MEVLLLVVFACLSVCLFDRKFTYIVMNGCAAEVCSLSLTVLFLLGPTIILQFRTDTYMQRVNSLNSLAYYSNGMKNNSRTINRFPLKLLEV